ncbi:MAG: DUF4433 domain-containing protein [Pyrinomonadaceae bacterium]
MLRSEVEELHYITPIAIVPSILQQGILSHTLADDVPHESVAMADIQDRRRLKQVGNGRSLHDYVNLYFNAHNPMLSRCRDRNSSICVLRVNPMVLDHSQAVFSDRNAAADMALFSTVDLGLAAIDRTRLFARYWTHPNDPMEESRHKAEMCAEALIPDRVDGKSVMGAYVANRAAREMFLGLKTGLSVQINTNLFF